MTLLLAFAVALLVAVLLSEVAERTVLSVTVIFLVFGFLVGPAGLSLVTLKPEHPAIRNFVEIALFAVLFVDGMHIGIDKIKEVWKLPGRALLFGMPLTMLAIGLLARALTGLNWVQSFLVSAVLSPTDPVFASAIVRRREVPVRLRRLLNVESGVNDGLALPIVLALLSLSGDRPFDLIAWLGEVVLGVILGAVIAWLILRIERLQFLHAVDVYEPLFVFTIGLLIYSLSKLVHANLFLAAFSAGVTIATVRPQELEAFGELGAASAEVLKLASVLIFGAILSLGFFMELRLVEVLFAVLSLLIARPLAIGIALHRAPMEIRERAAAAWFGPRGFASVVYGLLVYSSGIASAVDIFRIIAIVILASIIAHSSTDVAIASWFKRGYVPKNGQNGIDGLEAQQSAGHDGVDEDEWFEAPGEKTTTSR